MSTIQRIPLKDKGLGDKLSKKWVFYRKIVGESVILREKSLGNGENILFWRMALCESVRFFSKIFPKIWDYQIEDFAIEFPK